MHLRTWLSTEGRGIREKVHSSTWRAVPSTTAGTKEIASSFWGTQQKEGKFKLHTSCCKHARSIGIECYCRRWTVHLQVSNPLFCLSWKLYTKLRSNLPQTGTSKGIHLGKVSGRCLSTVYSLCLFTSVGTLLRQSPLPLNIHPRTPLPHPNN